jgi:enoyl-CoA hydratase
VSSVEIDRSGGEVAVVTLNRPERMNALSVGLVMELREAANEIHRDRRIRVAVLRGAGRGFCAGADLKGDDVRVPGTEQLGELGSIYKMQENLAETILALHECEKPIVAAIHGAAVGGGLALALASDVRIAAEGTRFGAVFIRVGLSSCDVGVSYFLPRLVGAGRAAELVLTGRHFDAARRIGSACSTPWCRRRSSSSGPWRRRARSPRTTSTASG